MPIVSIPSRVYDKRVKALEGDPIDRNKELFWIELFTWAEFPI